MNIDCVNIANSQNNTKQTKSPNRNQRRNASSPNDVLQAEWGPGEGQEGDGYMMVRWPDGQIVAEGDNLPNSSLRFMAPQT